MEIKVLKNILGANDQIAAANRQVFDSHNIFCVNVMASPGAGKTSLIMATIEKLRGKARVGVIEGDVASSIDAEKIGSEGIPVVQINTGGECHLEAGMTSNAIGNLPLDAIDILFIENVGNLICPVEFKLGEHKRLLIASVPEGDDKPFKYPAMFNEVDVVVVNKVDLLPYVKFDMDAFVRTINSINSKAPVFQVSSTTGQGVEEWTAWLLEQRKK